jgi:hypothetical protein
MIYKLSYLLLGLLALIISFLLEDYAPYYGEEVC